MKPITPLPAFSGTPTPRAGHTFRPDTLDKSVLVLTLCVWVGHFVLQSSLYSLAIQHFSDPYFLLARTVACIGGIATCLAMHVVLKRWSVDRPWCLLLKSILLSIPACAVVVSISECAYFSITSYYQLHPDLWLRPSELGMTFVGYQWMLFTWCALYVGAATILEIRRRDAHLAIAHSVAQQAQLLALHLQINPHFLFNTLNTLAGFIVLGRTRQSEKIVLDLARFLRYTLARTPSQFVVLAEEIDALRMYLDIETARFRDRLQVRYDVAPDCLKALVPGLILLPLAENSVKYGLGNSEHGIEIVVGARREGGSLLLWLADDGDASDDIGKGLGIGLSNIDQQLAALFGDEAELRAGATAQGWRNVVRMPWREADP